MYIIDKNKDYYDYLSHIYGVDKTVTFDRRGSILLTQDQLRDLVVYQGNSWTKVYYFVLEVGYVQYLFQVENVKQIQKPDYEKGIDGIWGGQWSFLHAFTDLNHFGKREICIAPCKVDSKYSRKTCKMEINISSFKESVKIDEDRIIDLPIIKDTVLTSIVNPVTLWVDLSNYISSKNNDKDIDLKMTDVEKAINHGFDKKSSFRNPIKFKE